MRRATFDLGLSGSCYFTLFSNLATSRLFGSKVSKHGKPSGISLIVKKIMHADFAPSSKYVILKIIPGDPNGAIYPIKYGLNFAHLKIFYPQNGNYNLFWT